MKTKLPLLLAIIVIILGFIIGLIGAFLFFPDLIKYPKITDLADFATLAATIILLLTILEMREQRKLTSKPSLIISNPRELYYEFIYDPGDKNPFNFALVDKNISIKNKDDVQKSQFLIKMYNIGFGASKDVKIQFKCDYSKFVERINQANVEQDFEISYSDGCVKIRYERATFKFLLLNFDYQLFDYILPIAIENKPVLIKLPQPFEFLYSSLIFSKFYSEMRNVPEYFQVPDIHLNITYSDIAQNEYKAKYILKFKHEGIQGTLENAILYGSGYLEIKAVEM